MIFTFFVFVFSMFLILLISFKLEAKAGSLWAILACECVLFSLQVFLKFSISFQHLKIRRFHPKKISRFPAFLE